jgi:predicted dehydrogenase
VTVVLTKPRIGFVGIGWIGQSRLQSVLDSGAAEVVGIADPAVPDAFESLSELLEQRQVDGIVIATPNALHAEQAVRALAAGAGVFCQKPLGRDSHEVEAVVDAARSENCLLGVDFSYRGTAAARRCRNLIEAGEIGPVYAAELSFHNVYGPASQWSLDPALAGGGCMIDLGIHLVDLALWALGAPRVADVEAKLLRRDGGAVEDYAVARLDLDGGATVSITCSWHLHAGRGAEIEASFFGTEGAVRLHNVAGSFYDFRAERCVSAQSEVIAEPPDEWGGRVICDWLTKLGSGAGYDPEIEHVVQTARVLDRIYGSEGP